MEFDVDDDGGVQATFQCVESFEGYPGILHGGVISSILDGAWVIVCLHVVRQP